MSNKQNRQSSPIKANQIHQKKQQKQIGDFIIGKVLGQGTFGKVRLAIHKHTKQKVAIKFLEKKKISEVADVERVSREIHILKLIRHPNLVQLYQIIQTQKQLLLIMQYMQNGQLFDYIVKNSRIGEEQARKMFHQIIDGVEYIHNIGITHRDLKPENILMSYNNTLKIVDFGLSNTYKKGQLLKTPCGSPCYAAPEMIQGEKYEGIKVDVWSCGIILFAMLCGYLPFEDENLSVLYKKILEGDYSFYRKVSEQAKDLIKHILNNNSKQRYTIDQIRNHSWMKKGNQMGIKCKQGIIIGYNKIPVDRQILKKTLNYGEFDIDYIEKCLQANRHNKETVLYYLTMKKHLKTGGISKFDMADQNFDKKHIQPVKRKDNLTEIFIDNFINKNLLNPFSIHKSTENQKNNYKKKNLKQQKQNSLFLVNPKKSKSKQKQNQRERERERSKQRSERESRQNSKIRDSLNLKSTIKDKQNSFCLSKQRQRTKGRMDKSINFNHQGDRSIENSMTNKRLKQKVGVNDNSKNNKVEVIYSKKNRCNSSTYYQTIQHEENPTFKYNGVKMINSLQTVQRVQKVDKQQKKQKKYKLQKEQKVVNSVLNVHNKKQLQKVNNKFSLQDNLNRKYKQSYNQSIVSKSKPKFTQTSRPKVLSHYEQNKQNIDLQNYSKASLSNKMNLSTINKLNQSTTNKMNQSSINKLNQSTMSKMNQSTINKLNQSTINKLNQSTISKNNLGKVEYKNYNTSIILNSTNDALNTSAVYGKKSKNRQDSGFVEEYLTKGKRNLGSQQKENSKDQIKRKSLINYGLSQFKSMESGMRGGIKIRKIL